MPIGSGWVRVSYVIGAAAYVCALAAVSSITGHAGQARTVSDGVYSAEQAMRGEQLYRAECEVCHGDALQGVVGPMLAGESFLAIWGGRPLADFVVKIQQTMPPQAPGSLTDAQAIDVTAFILRTGSFPAGSAPLTAAALGDVAFPGAAAAPPAAAGDIPLAPVSNLAQLMRGVTFPNANILFNAQVKDPGEEKPQAPIPFDYFRWGHTVYYGWQAVDQAALALRETTPLFLLPGRRCENGRPVPIDNADYQEYTQDLIEVSEELYRASQSRSVEQVAALAERLNETCANCHMVYRDVGTSEGGGLGADRCRP